MFYTYRLKDFYDAHTPEGVSKYGFLQSMDLSWYPFEIFNEITVSLLDAYIYSRFGKSVALDQWGAYAQYNKEEKRIDINAGFYAAFPTVLFVDALAADKYNDTILKQEFKSLSGSELEQVTYGEKTTEKNYDKVVLTITAGQDTSEYGAIETNHGARTDSIGNYDITYGARQDSVGAQHSEQTRGNDTATDAEMVYDNVAFLDKSRTTNVYGKQETNTHAYTNSTGAHTDQYSARQDSIGAQTVTQRSHTDTFKAGDKEHETAAREDTEKVTSHIDTTNRTKIILMQPKQYFEVQKELASKNVYNIVADAVYKIFAKGVW